MNEYELVDAVEKLLEKSKSIISKKTNWVKDWVSLKVDEDYQEADVTYIVTSAIDPYACRWCLTGALTKAFFSDHTKEFVRIAEKANDECFVNTAENESSVFSFALKLLADEISNNIAEPIKYSNGDIRYAHKVVSFNDYSDTTHEDVLNVFDKAIDMIEGIKQDMRPLDSTDRI